MIPAFFSSAWMILLECHESPAVEMVAQTEDNHSQPYLLNEHLCLSVVELKTNIKIYVYLYEVGICA